MSTTNGDLNTLKVTDRQGNDYVLSPVDSQARQDIENAKNLQFDDNYFEVDETDDEVNIGLSSTAFAIDNETPLVVDDSRGFVLKSTAPFATAIASDYNPQSTYAEGVRCMYKGKLYRCTTAIQTAEAWNSAHWTEEHVVDIIPAYESKAGAQGGTDLSLVTTGEKYVWNDWTSSDVTINKYYPPDILYYTNFENMTGLSSNQATDVPIVGNTMTYDMNPNYSDRPTLSTLTYNDVVLPCLSLDYTVGWNPLISASASISTTGLTDFTTECIMQFASASGTHVYVSLDGSSATNGLQIGTQTFFGKPLDVYIPGALQSTLTVYNGASKNEPDRIAVPVSDPYAAHKHQIYYNRTDGYWEYYCDNVRYIKGTTFPSWDVNLKLLIVNGGTAVLMKLAQFALTAGRKTELLYD